MKHTTLKSLIFVFFCMFVLSSCQNEAVEIQKKVKITISPANVLESFIPYKADDLGMMEDSKLGVAKLRITALIYDSKGNLYDHKETLLDNYDSDYSFDIVMKSDEEYKVLAFSSSIMGTLEEVTYEPYEFHDINDLSTLKVIQADESSYGSNFSVLGVLDYELTEYSVNTKLYLKAATSLVYLNWTNIHALHNITSNSIYGDYSASATDVDGNSYTWTITLEPGKEQNEVIINNFSPLLCDLGFTADQGINFYSGNLSGNKITVPAVQETGIVDSEVYKIYLLGLNPSTYDIEDIVIRIDSVNKTLTVENMFCLFSEKNEGTIYEMFDPGLRFTSSTSGSGSMQFDQYGIIYHNNDVVKYKDNGFVFTTTLDSIQNNGNWLYPSDYSSDSNNIYDMINLLPGSFNVFARTFIGNESEDYNNQTVSVKSGEQYVFKFDCAKLKLDIALGQLKSAMWNPGEANRHKLLRSKLLHNNYIEIEKIDLTKVTFGKIDF